MSLEMQRAALLRAHAAHKQLCSALVDLRSRLDTPGALRAVSVSITEAESSWLWLRAVGDRVGVDLSDVLS